MASMASPKRPTILFIDEDPDMLKLMEYVFAEEDFDLLTCRTPEDGLAVLAQGHVDCLLLDIHFARTPECLGLLGALRALPRGTSLPVLATSAMCDHEVARQALGLGARKFIPKPFYPGEILDEVRAVFAS